MNENKIKKILIIRLSALGDTIHTLPAVYALRKKFPDAQIDWVVEDKASKFVENNPLINNVFVINKKKRNLKSFLELIFKLRKEKYDIALDFQQLLKSGIILGFSGAKRRITLDCGREFSSFFANEIVKTGRKLFDIHYHVVKRNLDLVKYLGCETEKINFVLPDFSNEYSSEIKKIMQNIDKSKKTIVLSPATTWNNKHWEISGWQYLIKKLKNDYNIIITASASEKKLIGEILKDYNNCCNIINLSGKTSLSDLIYIYKQADLVISPDSGSTHSAWAAGTKSIITLFFATSARRSAPFGRNYFSVSASSKCSPCMKKHCKLKNNKNNCINSINPEQILELINKIL